MAVAAAAARDLHRWVASVVALTRLPAVGSEVYYFAQGHAEQWPSVAAPQAGQPMLPCTVNSVQCFTDGEVPYARISLLPGNHGGQPAADTRANPDSFLYFSKVLPHSDISRSYLVVPNLCAESMFPMLEVGSDTQGIRMSDLNGEPYDFVHKVGAQHTLKDDWGRFRGAKRAGVDDTVVFIRGSDQDIWIELRPKNPAIYHGLQPLQELTESSELAELGVAFTITYYPGRGSGSPFVVPRGAVDEAIGKVWESGMEVRMRPRDVVLDARGYQNAIFDVTIGTINTVMPGVWRNLQVDLDASGSSSNRNMWEVEPTRDPPPAAKRSKVSTDLRLSGDGDDQGPSSAKKPENTLTLMDFPIKN